MEGGAARRVGPVDGLEKRLDELMMRELPSATQSANWGASLRSAIRAAETKRCKTEGRMEIRGENSDWPLCHVPTDDGSTSGDPPGGGLSIGGAGGSHTLCNPSTRTHSVR